MKTGLCELTLCVLIQGGFVMSAGAADPSAAAELRYKILPYPPGMSVGLEILVDGQPVPTIHHKGRTYLPVPYKGAEYQIRVWNHGSRRIAAIVSVDGLSVINGRHASEASPGYLVDPSSRILIKGWRRNMERVAAFSFVDRADSYARLTGHPENIGVIGLLAIEEQGPRPVPLEEKANTRSFTDKRMASGVGSVGTGYGREIDSQIYYVPFIRSPNKRTITLYYDTEEALRKAGILGEPSLPTPFPDSSEFAPPPPGYKRR